MQRSDARHDREPQPEAAGVAVAAGVESRERPEDGRAIDFGNSFAVVFDDEAVQVLVAHDGDVHFCRA